MKKPKPLEIKENAALVVRRRARLAVGSVKPGKVIAPAATKPPKHKKQALLQDSEG